MRETKRFQFKLDEEQSEAEAGVFSGYGAVFGNIDDGNDIIEPGAFTETLKDISRVKLMLQHNYELLPLGLPTELHEDEHGLHITAFISDTSTGRDVKVLIRDHVLKELSIGYDIPPGGFDIDDHGVRHLRQINLLEISVVTWAMNDQAQIKDYKALELGAQALTRAAALEAKEGRKISGPRLKALKEAAATMKTAYKALNALIKEAEGEGHGKARQPPVKAPAKRRRDPALSHSGKNIKFEIST